MALPKRRHSRARVGSRRAYYKARSLNLGECSRCHATVLAHHACPKCGAYKGVKVDHTVKEKKEERK
jgi:large subunit ribosomal protein L32